MRNAAERPLCIVSPPGDMTEGLFGQVLLFVFEILPFLHERSLFPDWRICAANYGCGGTQLVIPGVLDLAYEPPAGEPALVPLMSVRQRGCRALGNDWAALHRLWSAYFKIPERFHECADVLGALESTLGVHYRGTDKLTASWDTNPVAHDEYLAIINDVLASRPHLNRIYLATDDNRFHEYLQRNVAIPVANLGPVPFHKAPVDGDSISLRTERAMLDSVILARCGMVLQNSSALSGFSKVWNPQLDVQRVAASKRFADIPYFPVAYLPIYQPGNPDVARLVERLARDDWAREPAAEPFQRSFAYIERPGMVSPNG